ncbi:MAG TPA: pyridoxal-phosphate dependent enzyme [Chloroflexota bacterium]
MRCSHCGATFGLDPLWEGCPACRRDDFVYTLEVDYDEEAQLGAPPSKAALDEPGGVWRFDPLLPVATDPKITLEEGRTALVDCPRLAAEAGVARLLIKDESRNPTWSHKDRANAVAVSDAIARGARAVTLSSSGNHGISAAAYAARAGMGCVVFVLDSAPLVARTVIQAYGAIVVATDMFGRWQLMEEGVRRYGWYPLGGWTRTAYTGNPYGAEGYKTIAYEICQQLDWQPPDVVVVPTAGAEVLYGIHRGFVDARRLGWIDRLPRLVAAEPAVGAPTFHALESGLDYIPRVNVSPTVATSIGASIGSYRGLLGVRDSDGMGAAVSEDEILSAYAVLGRREGLFVEPSSAASVAAALQLGRAGQLTRSSTVVCISTSSGMKDPSTAEAQLAVDVPVIEPDFEEFRRAAGVAYGERAEALLQPPIREPA